MSGHIDSWDVGQGAMDDGGGAFISWQALSTLRSERERERGCVCVCVRERERERERERQKEKMEIAVLYMSV